MKRDTNSSHRTSQLIAPAGFRLMVKTTNKTHALVALAETRMEVVGMATEFRDAIVAHRVSLAQRKMESQDGISAIYVQHWVGSATLGRWAYVWPARGGFYHVFPNPSTNGKPSLPRSGTDATCILAKKTRKRGWTAKLGDHDVAGPITNSADVPETAEPGDPVILRIESIKRKRVQFRWVPQAD